MIIFDANNTNYTRLTSNRHDVRVFMFGLALGLFLGSLTLYLVLDHRVQNQMTAVMSQISTLKQERDTALSLRDDTKAEAATCQDQLDKMKKQTPLTKVPVPKPRPQAKQPPLPTPPPRNEGKLLKVGEEGEVAPGLRLSLIGISRHPTKQFCIVIGNNVPDSLNIPSGGEVTVNNIDQVFTVSAELQGGDSCRISARAR